MRTSVLLCLTMAVAGCAPYEAEPLADRRILDELRAATLESAGPAVALRKGVEPFDPADGLSEEEAVSLALSLNPGLRALRAGKGVAEAQLLAAGLYPDPELDASWLDRPDGTVLEGSLLQLLPLAGEKRLRKEKAGLRLSEVDLEIGSAEWRLAQQVRITYGEALAAEEGVTVASQALRLRERLLGMVQTRQELGAVPPLEGALVSLDVAAQRRAWRTAETERAQARQELNRLLGLGPKVVYALQAQGDPWPLGEKGSLPELAELEETALVHRLDLAAAQRAYEQAEKDLQLATRGQYPRLRIGPAYGAEEGERGFGIGAGVDLPLWNRNRGEIAEKLARRRQLAEEFRASLATLRADLARALADLAREDAMIRSYQEEVGPALNQALALVEENLNAGKVDAAALLLIQDRALDARREGLATRQAYRKAALCLDEVLGCPLSRIQVAHRAKASPED